MTYTTIGSAFRNSSTSSTANFTQILKTSVEGKRSISLKEVIIPMAQFTIRSGINDRIDFNSGGVKVATITPGPYNATTLLTEVLTQLKAADANFLTCTKAFTGLVTITSGAAFTLLPVTGANASRSILPTLGFVTDSTSSATSQTGANVLIVNRFNSLYIGISQFGQPNQVGNGQTYTFRVPIDEDNGEVLKWTEGENYAQVINISPGTTQRYSQFTVSLYYATGETVDLLGADWELTCLIE